MMMGSLERPAELPRPDRPSRSKSQSSTGIHGGEDNVWKRITSKHPVNGAAGWRGPSFRYESLGHFLKAHEYLLSWVNWRVSRIDIDAWLVNVTANQHPINFGRNGARSLPEAALAAYEDAGIRGLCADGRWEAALAAIRHLDLSLVLDPPADSARSTKAPRR